MQKICKHMQKYEIICKNKQNMQKKYANICKNIQKYAKYVKICKNMKKICKIWRFSNIAKICPQGGNFSSEI